MHNIYVGLGSNLGDRLAHLQAALGALARHVDLIKQSSVYESVPYGVGEQPLYLNMVVHVTTSMSPRQLLVLAKKIEHELGRLPDTHQQPRPIDIDILLYGDLVHQEDDLVIPHQDMHQRHFVLVPLEEIAPLSMHPILKKSVADLLDELGGYREIVRLYEEQL